jgi:tRNA(Arg) A34 adenosine deaminase TadA
VTGPTLSHDELLTRSFELALAARARGDHPFGALLAIDGVVVAEAENLVNSTADITAHAETVLVRELQRTGRLDLLAAGTVFASCEPCPMCVGAMFWAGARRVVYGLSSERLTDVATTDGAQRFGFTITAPEIGSAATPPMTFDGPQREDEAVAAHVGFWTS